MFRGVGLVRRVKVSCAVLGALVWTAPATGQNRTQQPAAPPRASDPATIESHAQDPARAHAARVAALLNPADYDPAFYTGAQAEFLTPETGATGIVVASGGL